MSLRLLYPAPLVPPLWHISGCTLEKKDECIRFGILLNNSMYQYITWACLVEHNPLLAGIEESYTFSTAMSLCLFLLL